jgi:hypothetical protein
MVIAPTNSKKNVVLEIGDVQVKESQGSIFFQSASI